MQIKDIPGFQKFDMIVTLAPQMKVSDAVRLMSSVPVGAAPVLEGKDIVGVFSERDLMIRVVAEKLDPESLVVADVMTINPVTVSCNDTNSTAAEIMINNNFRNLPVLGEDGHILGVLTIADVVKTVVNIV